MQSQVLRLGAHGQVAPIGKCTISVLPVDAIVQDTRGGRRENAADGSEKLVEMASRSPSDHPTTIKRQVFLRNSRTSHRP
jgi:hypothetical protein